LHQKIRDIYPPGTVPGAVFHENQGFDPRQKRVYPPPTEMEPGPEYPANALEGRKGSI
jgi:hypothetical protein